jgi:hypothetical protein
MTSSAAIFRFRLVMGIFIFGLVVSGLTAFPLLAEMKALTTYLGLADSSSAAGHSGLSYWILTVRFGLENTYRQYPWIAYGTDWLAFAHIIIAVFFVGPLVRPAESRWILASGVIACILVIPLALICGSFRGIPFYWRLIDCSFGVLGIFPLIYCIRLLRHIEARPN